ncbi:hypothetical protein AYI68_g4256 [Smittium mucronatum]|uniref:Inner nuclear membrane protein SRC1 n=1 Tax=Smittium mucronatum TaxID=133383 RepID=A0A1R0GXL5_9FUNG|nr:hypothetical protein AYI68_g4256 [Smittium mucronatum]
MDSAEKLDYTSSGFDPSSLKAPELRSILIKHGVNYSSNSKKDELVSLFKENVKSGKIKSDPPITKKISTNSGALLDQLTSPIYNNKLRSPAKKDKAPKIEDSARSNITPVRTPERRGTRSSSRILQDNQQDTDPNSPPPKFEIKDQKPISSSNPSSKAVFSEENPFQTDPGVEKKRSRIDDSEDQPKKSKKKKKSRKKKTKSENDLIENASTDSKMDVERDSSINDVIANSVKAETQNLIKSKVEVDNSESSHFLRNSTDHKPEYAENNRSVHLSSQEVPASSNLSASTNDSTMEYSSNTTPIRKTNTPSKSRIPDIQNIYSPVQNNVKESFPSYPPISSNIIPGTPTSNHKVSELVAIYEHTRPVTRSSRNSLNSSPIKNPESNVPFLESNFQKVQSVPSEKIVRTEKSDLPAPERYLANRPRTVSEVDEKNIIEAQKNFKKTLESRARVNSNASEKYVSSRKSSLAQIQQESILKETGLIHSPQPPTKSNSGSSISTFYNLLLFSIFLSLTGYIGRNYIFFNVGYYQTRSNSVIENHRKFDFPENNLPIFHKLNKYASHLYSHYIGPIGFPCPEHATCLKDNPIPFILNPAGPRDSIFSSNSKNELDFNKIVFQCDTGYIVKHPIRIFSITLLSPPICVRDQSTESRVKELVNLILNTLKSHRGAKECERSISTLTKIMISKIKSHNLSYIFSPPTFTEWELIIPNYTFESDDPDLIESVGMSINDVNSAVKGIAFMPDTEFDYLFSKAKDIIRNNLSLGVQFFNLESEPTATENDLSENENGNEQTSLSSEKFELYYVSTDYELSIISRFRLYTFFFLIFYSPWVLNILLSYYLAKLLVLRSKSSKMEKQTIEEATILIFNLLEFISKYHYLDPIFATHSNVLTDQLFDYLFFGNSQIGARDSANLAMNAINEDLENIDFYNLNDLDEILSISGTPYPNFPIANFDDPRTRTRIWKQISASVSSSRNVKSIESSPSLSKNSNTYKSWEWIGPINLRDSM